MRFYQSKSNCVFYFVAVDSTDLVTRETGLSGFTFKYSIDAGAVTSLFPFVSEVSSTDMPGVYTATFTTPAISAGVDMEEMVVHITHASMAPVSRTFEISRVKVATEGTALTLSAIADSVWDEVASDHNTAGTTGAELQAGGGDATLANQTTILSNQATILADTNELQTNQGDWATATGFSTFDHTVDQVVASNMRGTDGANTVAPDNASITSILADTNELQTNQGDWATATGFSTFDHTVNQVVSSNMRGTDGANTVAPDNASITAILADTNELQVNQGDWATADVSSLLTTSTYNASLPSNFSTLIIGTGGDAGMVTTSNPASGGGSAHTAADVAALILATPANKLVTNVSGQVEASNAGSGGATASEVVTAMQAVAGDFKADVSGLSTFDHSVDVVTTDSASREASKATGFSTHDASNVADAVWDESHSSHAVSGSYGAHVLLSTTQNHEVQVTGSNHVAADVHEFQSDVLTADATDATFVAEVGGSGGGGATAQEVYDLFTSGTNEDAFKADTTLLAKSSELAQLSAGGTGLNQITVTVQDSLGNGLQGAKINVDDTVISLVTPISGDVVFNLDLGSAKLDVLPPAGYDTPASQTINVTGDGNVVFTLTESSTSTGGNVNWIG